MAALSIRLNVGVAASLAAKVLARPELVTTFKEEHEQNDQYIENAGY